MSDIQRVKVVRVACDGEPVVHGSPIERFKNYDLPTTHDIFTKGSASDIAKMIGIPLVVLKVTPSRLVTSKRGMHQRVDRWGRPVKPAPEYGYKENGDYFPNSVAALLMSQDQQTWGGSVGSVMLARRDGKPFYREHLEVMLNFFKIIDEFLSSGSASPDEYKSMMTPLVFENYYEGERAGVGKDMLSQIPSPFGKEDIQIKGDAEDVEMVDEAIVMA